MGITHLVILCYGALFFSQLREHEAVKYIEEDGIVRKEETWGLDRIDQRHLPLDDEYKPIGEAKR